MKTIKKFGMEMAIEVLFMGFPDKIKKEFYSYIDKAEVETQNELLFLCAGLSHGYLKTIGI